MSSQVAQTNSLNIRSQNTYFRSQNGLDLTLTGADFVDYIKNIASLIPSNISPTILTRLESLNSNLGLIGITYKTDTYYYYLIENIPQDKIGSYTSIVSDLKEPYVISLKAFVYSNSKNLSSYNQQYGLSQIVFNNYKISDTKSFLKDEKIFLPFEPKNFNNTDINTFIDQYNYLTSFVNNNTTNEQKLYTLLFLAKPTNNFTI